MKEKSKNASLTIMLGASFIASLAMGITSNATENPFETTSLNTSYMLADGHKHTLSMDEQRARARARLRRAAQEFPSPPQTCARAPSLIPN